MNKAEIFKRHLWKLIESGQYVKAKQCRQFIYNYFLRKGQKTEYVYCIARCVDRIEDITDEMLDSVA